MKRLTRWSLALGALLALCGVAPGAAMADGPKTEVIRLQDACDLDSFNANPLTAGGCVRDAGGVSAEEFLAKINPKDFGHRAWWFNTSGGRVGTTTIRAGDTLRAVNEGGEIHSFTEVAQFGPGCVPEINQAAGLSGPPAADCALMMNAFVAPGAEETTVSGLQDGVHRFECLIHPWMQTTITVR